MEIETHIKIEFEDMIGDNFEEGTTEGQRKELIERHIQDYCREHKIERQNVKVIE